jgi:hypothetical protein
MPHDEKQKNVRESMPRDERLRNVKDKCDSEGSVKKRREEKGNVRRSKERSNKKGSRGRGNVRGRRRREEKWNDVKWSVKGCCNNKDLMTMRKPSGKGHRWGMVTVIFESRRSLAKMRQRWWCVQIHVIKWQRGKWEDIQLTCYLRHISLDLECFRLVL